MTNSIGATGPHGSIPSGSTREQFALQLFDTLWDRYRSRVSYVESYEEMIRDAGARFVNDHIAFRTIACQKPMVGIMSIARIFDALGYLPVNCYTFPDKSLNAIHYQHSNPQFPKLFISELKLWELSPQVSEVIANTLQSHREPVSLETLSLLHGLDDGPGSRNNEILASLVREFHELPWECPRKQDVQMVAKESQYAAWVLVHGYGVNHFTSLVNSHGVESLDDLEKTAAALKARGVPMKSEIEGASGSKLRQTATEAVMVDVDVQDAGRLTTMPWTYAYFELAERGPITDPETGKSARFEGFLGPQATNLFEMTKIRNS